MRKANSEQSNNTKETINYYPFGSEMRMSSPYQIIRKTGGLSRCVQIILLCCLLASCNTQMPINEFFCIMSTKDVPDVSIDSIQFQRVYIDGSCIKCGTIENPLFCDNIKYDTLSRYRVVVVGNVFFEQDDDSQEEYEKIDSVGIESFIVIRPNSPREFYSNNPNWSNKRWKECPLPKRVLEEIKKDFLKRMKYKRYRFNKSALGDMLPIKGYATQYEYRLY